MTPFLGSANPDEEIDNIFGHASSPFEHKSFEESTPDKPIRVSGNEMTLLKTMTQGDIREDILREAKRGII